MSIQSTEYRSSESFEALREQWQQLDARSEQASVFSTWEWQSAWWRHYGAGRSLLLLTASRDGRVLGILPVYVAQEPALPLTRVRVLRLGGTGGDTSPDYLGPILAPEAEIEAARCLAQALLDRSNDWDRMDLTDLSPGCFEEALVAAFASRGQSLHRQADKKILIARLPDTWDAFLAAMSRDRRYRVRHQRRTAAEKAGVRFDVCTTLEEVKSALDELISLHRARWDSKQPDAGAFRSHAYLSFHRDAILNCRERGWIRFYRLRVQDRAVAVFYCYLYRGEAFYFQSGFDPSLEKLSLGHVLMGHSIEAAIGEGARVFDMLQGDHGYKQSWCNSSRGTVRMISNNNTIRGRLCTLKEKIKGVLKQFRPAPPTASASA